MAKTRLNALPEECLSRVISFTCPRDACRSSLVSGDFHDAADSDLSWERFLPLDYHQIIMKSVSPLEYSSKKELFLKLSSTPLLIDGGKKTFSLDIYTNKKCYMLSARELSIAWSTNSLCWCWKPLLYSRFPEAVELIMVCWLEIRGRMNTRMLSPNTTYGAYLVVQLANRAFGLDVVSPEVSVEVGDYKTRGEVSMNCPNACKRQLAAVQSDREERVPRPRGDGWWEVELGVFYNDGSEKQVIMDFSEIKGHHIKAGLLVEGIELRPTPND